MEILDYTHCRYRWHLLAELTQGMEIGLEVGVLKGRNLSNLLAKNTGLFMYGVDPWNVPHGRHTAQRVASYKEVAEAAVAKYRDRVQFIQLESKKAALTFEDACLDFVFIDGDHEYESVKEDIALWLPKVRHGGFLAGHDYDSPLWEGVTQAVNEAIPDGALKLFKTGERCKCWGMYV